MKKRTSVAVVAVAAAASWVLPGVKHPADHEFLTRTARAAPAADPASARIEPVQLALLFQLNSR